MLNWSLCIYKYNKQITGRSIVVAAFNSVKIRNGTCFLQDFEAGDMVLKQQGKRMINNWRGGVNSAAQVGTTDTANAVFKTSGKIINFC